MIKLGYILLTIYNHFSLYLGNNANAQDGTDDGSGVIQQVDSIVDEFLSSDIYFLLVQIMSLVLI